MTAPGCLFCSIVAGGVPAARVLDDELCVAFLDARPLMKGHVLVVPRAHHETLLELPAATLPALFTTVQRLVAAVTTGLGAEGAFVALNHKVSQSVPHLHVHVVPRRKGDGLRGFFWPRGRYESDAEAAEVAQRIAAALPPG
ncbi:MAG TPA: HIT family protein [Polyangia bacterium]|jgi:histidine triad (HIT) family protein